jgi:hypothetical protein
MKNLIYVLFAGMLLLSACEDGDSKIQLMNDKAALPASFKFDSLGLKVMSSFINKKAATMSVLYANPLALNNAIIGNKKHAAGEVMALVTWKQQADDHWFGAKIPANFQSVEMVKTIATTTGTSTFYNSYVGKNLLADPDTSHKQDRIKYVFDQQPSVMP